MGTDTLEVEYDYYLSLANLYDTIDLEVPWDWKQQQQDMPTSKSQRIGAIAESRFITECLERNFEPHVPTTPMPWDFIVTCPAGTLKVQIKSTNTKTPGESYQLNTSAGCRNKDPMCDSIDVVGCYVGPAKMWWMIPRNEINGVSIKLNPEHTSKSKYKKYQENWSLYYE
jgi:hypothetical protein